MRPAAAVQKYEALQLLVALHIVGMMSDQRIGKIEEHEAGELREERKAALRIDGHIAARP